MRTTIAMILAAMFAVASTGAIAGGKGGGKTEAKPKSSDHRAVQPAGNKTSKPSQRKG